MIKLKDIKKKYPNFILDYLNYSEYPRLRILFSDKEGYYIDKHEMNLIKKRKDKILDTILKKSNNVLFILLSFSISSLGEQNIADLLDNKIDIEKYQKEDVIEYEDGIYAHIYSGKINKKDIVYITDLIINSENYNLEGVGSLDTIFYITNENLSKIINVYGFHGMDIISNEQEILIRVMKNLEGSVKKDFILSDKILPHL